MSKEQALEMPLQVLMTVRQELANLILNVMSELVQLARVLQVFFQARLPTPPGLIGMTGSTSSIQESMLILTNPNSPVMDH
jgi:hypothetical protein